MTALANCGCEDVCKNSDSVEFCFLPPVTTAFTVQQRKEKKSKDVKDCNDYATPGSFVKLEMEGQKLTAHVVVYTTHLCKYSKSSGYSMYSVVIIINMFP